MRVFAVDVALPAGTTTVTVQPISESDGSPHQPASLAWVVGALTVPVTPPEPPNPPPPGAGTGTLGYWKNHADAWPLESITLGGVEFSKDDALAILRRPTKGDATLILARQLIATKLNVANGTDPSCISGTIAEADDFLAMLAVGSGLRARDHAWETGEPLAQALDAYNNGELCAPARD